MTAETATPETAEELEAMFDKLSAERDAAAGLKSFPVTDKDGGQVSADEPLVEDLTDVPEQTAKREETPAAAPAAAPESATPAASGAPAKQPPDLSGLTPEQRAYFEKIENERRAAVGRSAALQRQVQTLQHATKQASSASQDTTPDPEEDDLREFPELKRALEKQSSQMQATLDRRLVDYGLEVQVQVLSTLFPAWQEQVRSDAFNYWLSEKEADPGVQSRVSSGTVADTAALLRQFEAETQPAAQPSSGTQDHKQAQADALAERRRRNIESAAHVAGRPRPASKALSGEPDPDSDPDGYFNFLSRQRDERRARGLPT